MTQNKIRRFACSRPHDLGKHHKIWERQTEYDSPWWSGSERICCFITPPTPEWNRKFGEVQNWMRVWHNVPFHYAMITDRHRHTHIRHTSHSECRFALRLQETGNRKQIPRRTRKQAVELTSVLPPSRSGNRPQRRCLRPRHPSWRLHLQNIRPAAAKQNHGNN